MLQVVGVGRYCRGLNYLGGLYGARAMDRQTCSNCAYKVILLSTNENQCWERVCAVFSYMRDCFEKHKKKVFKNLTEMLMFPYRSDVAE